MSGSDPITADADTLAEIDVLTSESAAELTRQPRLAACELPGFAPRCRALLASHLGFEPDSSVQPVHVLGDSHSQLFSGSDEILLRRFAKLGLIRRRWINRGPDLLPCFRSYHLGPTTAWMAAEHQSSTRSRAKTELLLARHIPAGATVMTCFGEIDCRIHMPRRVLTGRTVTEVAQSTAERFFPLLRLIRERGFQAVVWGVAQAAPQAPDQPQAALLAIGSEMLRLEITYAYNDALAALCQSEGFPFVSLAGTFHPRDELMPEIYFHDRWHLSQVLMPHALRTLRDAGVLTL